MYHYSRNSENQTHIFLKNIQMVTLQHHKSISPDFSKNAFATELTDPAHFVWLCGRWCGILNTLLERERKRVNLDLYHTTEELVGETLLHKASSINPHTQHGAAENALNNTSLL